jgi:hypothetical protein
MKKLASILALAILVSSCGNQLSIVKRHYTKGFYVENGKKSRHLDVAKANTKNKPAEKIRPTVLSFLSEEKNQPAELSASATNSIKKEEKKNSFQSQLKKHTAVKEQNNILKKESENNRKLFSLKEKQNKAKGSNDDANTILLVILSLFPILCLIAVYLHDGKEITTNFWVTLVLHLTVYLECIFAILVVLDIIDLK